MDLSVGNNLAKYTNAAACTASASHANVTFCSNDSSGDHHTISTSLRDSFRLYTLFWSNEGQRVDDLVGGKDVASLLTLLWI